MARPISNFPDSWGANRACVFPHNPPGAYTRITAPSPPGLSSGGDIVYAAEAGFKAFSFLVSTGLSDSGLYRVEAVPVTASDDFPGAIAGTYRLAWYVAASGTEVATGFTLSNETIRLLGIGPS